MQLEMTIGDYLGRRALYSPNQPALVDVGQTPPLRLTYGQMNERANRLANWLQREAGVGKGARVAVLARDGIAHLDSFFACSKLGAMHMPLNWRLHWRELAGMLAITRPRVLIYSGEFLDGVEALQGDARSDPIRSYVHLAGSDVQKSVFYEDVVTQAAPEPVFDAAVNEEDIAALIFTGGTTGLPRPAQISHRMIAWNTLNTIIHDLHHGDRYLNVFPMYHTGGLFVYTTPNVILGGTSILMPQFDADRVLQLIEEEQVTIFAAVPTMYQMLTQASGWQEADLSSLRFCTSGGSPLPVELIKKYTKEKGVRFKQGFGMTEFGPGIFALAAEDAVRKAGSIGRPNFYVGARIVDDNHEAVGAGEIGELVLKGPSRSSGYFGEAEEEDVVDEQGWFHTGDLATYDEEWYFFIKDRKKDMFISGGENVYPAEIEAVLYRHAAVHQCAVIGVPDDVWGERGVAYVVLAPDVQASEVEILEHLRENLATFKVPREVALVEALPLSGAGKILKRELREQYLENT